MLRKCTGKVLNRFDRGDDLIASGQAQGPAASYPCHRHPRPRRLRHPRRHQASAI
jgi:hypothetical protein